MQNPFDLPSPFELAQLAIQLASYAEEDKWPTKYLDDALGLWERAKEKTHEAEIAYREAGLDENLEAPLKDF